MLESAAIDWSGASDPNLVAGSLSTGIASAGLGLSGFAAGSSACCSGWAGSDFGVLLPAPEASIGL